MTRSKMSPNIKDMRPVMQLNGKNVKLHDNPVLRAQLAAAKVRLIISHGKTTR